MNSEDLTIEESKPRRRKSFTPPASSSSESKNKSDENNSDKIEPQDDIKNIKKQIHHRKNVKSDKNDDNLSEDEDEQPMSSTQRVSLIIKNESDSIVNNISSKKNLSVWKNLCIVVIIVIIIKFLFSNENSNTPSNDNNWRLKVDPNNTLSHYQRHVVRASLKPILDKSSTKLQDEEDSVSTLLILSSNEEYAAKLARCILRLVNTEIYKDQISTEIDLQSHRGGKLRLDSNLKYLLSAGGDIRAVLLRHIDDNSSSDAFERLRLLFAYCDGENPVIPHRLIIMTATSDSVDETELREKFKIRWPKEHDFVDALMSRISGHTLYVENDQKSIC
ncbi:unnamed protein product [Rotaria sordida]|uniref:Uncharacterized protein n=1 Tax=Rotaria sordida TaxID=392033 RepID=A0A815BMW0_9BILA|nr:unnamed protein product [Rotaria sordida]CAF1013050.1 unnamed protein product [Rotaria sordida]CAF1168205.1 unnamed protein product [Rotaria sordida]CAF1175758.1 unnamed protein product [Rotaria sordida]CAF1271973.1 unnamed protein product [Rotaria sordida]